MFTFWKSQENNGSYSVIGNEFQTKTENVYFGVASEALNVPDCVFTVVLLSFFLMNESDKFIADLRRIVKYERAKNGGRLNIHDVCEKIADFFARANPLVPSLAAAVFDYWTRTYVDSSLNIDLEPTEENLYRLCAMKNFLCGVDDKNEILCERDWKELSEAVRFEAEDIPLDLLERMMAIVVDKDAL
ncbi:hypothetical protein HRQ91_00360 [Treponema parvum]|uniref:Uncharacterized protein n=1 Tax=Treponema parvum TaxID=138851 RepID=A0A975F2D8_9SPIR|nr:hypothetical protein [Treponema parvum]QTQ13030.1 hypothetical protein HRQ91_00360 [Treponema parvum]